MDTFMSITRRWLSRLPCPATASNARANSAWRMLLFIRMQTIRPQNILASYSNPLTIVPHTLAEAEVTTPRAQKLSRYWDRLPVEKKAPAMVPAEHSSDNEANAAELDVYA
jgi:hypothetical protein